MKFATISLISVFLFNGCGTLEYCKEPQYIKEARGIGEDPDHINSCGPDAVYDALSYFHKNVKFKREPFSKKEISKIIQARHTTSCRNILSVFDNRARQVTFISDMMAVLNHYGIHWYELTSRNLDEVHKKEGLGVAIVLVKRKGAINYHWMTYPFDSKRYIENFFAYKGEGNTVIKKVYILFRL
ncbi:MAG: hypothetical protein H8E05_01050 [Bacteroidetes bacterium]|nr:hypothetical protein [Bacteroidota bacterium]